MQYLPYPKAMAQLHKRLSASPEELAAWIWVGPKEGGIAAFANANELDPPPRLYFGVATGNGDDHDYVAPLMSCWFSADEIAAFNPADRYITGEALIQRWGDRPGLRAEAWVRAKIRESRLLDLHPLYGGTQGTWPEDASMPPMTTGLFRLSDVEAIEAEDFAVDWEPASDLQPGSEQVVELDSQVVTPTYADTEAPSSPVEVSSDAASLIEGSSNDAASAASPSQCSVFMAMSKLAASELSIVFVGDRADFGLGANNMVEVSARNKTRRIPLAALDLVDRRKGGLNSQGLILIGMAHGQKLTTSPQNSTKMKRLRDTMKKHFGLAGDPFEPYRKGAGWVPHFKILDKRGAADERAKREAERKTDSYEQMIEHGSQFTYGESAQQDSDDEPDAADEWLNNNDPDRSE